MKIFTTVLMVFAIMLAIPFVNSTIPSAGPSVAAQSVAQKSKRKGRYVVRRTWNGSRWVTRKVYVGSRRTGKRSWKAGRKVVSRSKKVVR
jgi:hypothetical protein